MFEDFRKQVEEAALASEEQEAKPEPVKRPPSDNEGYFLGMTPFQRFIVALLVLVMLVIVGGLFLVVTMKVVL